MTALPQRRIGPFSVSALGLGCMNMSHAYAAPPPAEQAERVLLHALDLGITLFDTAALYGFGANETLVGRVMRPHRHRFTLASKGGIVGITTPEGQRRQIDARPDALRGHCEDSLRRLGTEVIDLYYLHRHQQAVPIEDSVGALADLIRQGKVRAIGLSEVSATTLRRAHAVHPIAALQSEYSLWTRNPEIATLAACRELGVAFVAFSPVARGYLGDALLDPGSFESKDIRRAMPRFTPEHWAANRSLHDAASALAHQAGYSLPALSLAWLLSRGEQVIPIPGTTRIDHLEQLIAAAAIPLDDPAIAAINALVNRRTVSGPRYNPINQSEIDTEDFAD